MQVDIWSDIRCPFCYIGKHHFEAALAGFDGRNEVQVMWHSFELDPGMQTDQSSSIYQYLAKTKQISLEQSKDLHARVTAMARATGLEYDFDRVVVAHSFDAHRLIQFARMAGKAEAAEEALFRAYFNEGVNISDPSALTGIGEQIGLAGEQVQAMLDSGAYADDVRYDQRLARETGIQAVPFFLFEDKFAVSGAQPVAVFEQVLRRTQNYLERVKK